MDVRFTRFDGNLFVVSGIIDGQYIEERTLTYHALSETLHKGEILLRTESGINFMYKIPNKKEIRDRFGLLI